MLILLLIVAGGPCGPVRVLLENAAVPGTIRGPRASFVVVHGRMLPRRCLLPLIEQSEEFRDILGRLASVFMGEAFPRAPAEEIGCSVNDLFLLPRHQSNRRRDRISPMVGKRPSRRLRNHTDSTTTRGFSFGSYVT